MREELRTYSNPCGILSVYEIFLYKEFSNLIFCKMSKTFLWGLYFWFWMKTVVKIAKTNFSRRIFPLQTWQRDRNVNYRLVNNFRDVDQPGNMWFELIHVILI